MSFESLPNELLLNIFKFLTTADILRTFFHLNSRFHSALLIYLNEYGLNFRSISKENFDFLCQRYLSSIASAITQFSLSDDDGTPYQSKIFLANNLTLNQFINLKSLSLYEIRSSETLKILINDLSHLSNLTNIKLIKCFTEDVQPSCEIILNQIWNLPKLTHCYFDITFGHDLYLAPIKTSSLSLKHLTIESISCSLAELTKLFECTKNLEHISIHTRDTDNRQILPIIPSLTSLELYIEKSERMMMNLLNKTINLCHLKVSSSTIHLNGHQWERIINDHLPQLKILQFKFNYSCSITNCEQETGQLIDSFKSRFWLEDHKWYIRCHLTLDMWSGYINFYTIPYAFSGLSFTDNTICKSTCPDTDNNWSYEQVKNLSYNESFQPSNSFHPQIHFPNIHHLSIPDSVDEQFWLSITKLNKLKSLEISRYVPLSIVQLILDQTTQLYSLTLHDFMFTLNNTSIRRLNLLSQCDYLTSEQCDELSHSSLINRCEILLLKIKNEMDILLFINNLNNLRALKIQCEKDSWTQERYVENDPIIEKLRHYLPSTVEIGRDLIFKYFIHIWIR